MELLRNLQLFIDFEAHAVICCRKECQSALSIAGSHVTTHLREKHHIPEDARKGLTRILKSIPGLLSPDLIQPRKDGSTEHPHLRTHDGFHCDGCIFRAASFQLIKRHFSNQEMQGKCLHFGKTQSSKNLDSLFHYVYLQTWASGPGRQYWIVERNGSQQRPNGGQGVQNHLRLVRERELEHKQPGLPLDPPAPTYSESSKLTFAEKGPWLETSCFDRLKLDIRCDVKLINTGLKHSIRPPVLSYLYFFN